MDDRATLKAVHDFWFGQADETGAYQRREAWWKRSDRFDDQVREHCLVSHEAAVAGDFAHLIREAEACLTVCVLLDQVPRNAFRGTPRAFATDNQALATAIHAVDLGLDQQIDPIRRTFLYTPFEHAEDLEMQRRSIELFSAIRKAEDGAETMFHANRHYEIIERFGRFPHRNVVLGRETTLDEAEFLKEPWSSY